VTPALLHAQVGPASVWCSSRSDANLGDHVGDYPAAVARNRERFAARVGLGAPSGWVWLRQVHGAGVFAASGPTGPGAPPEADAAVTTVRGLPLAIVTADCAPVVVANDDAVAVVHAGHRGLAAGVVEAAVEAVRVRGTGEVRAFLGPCIRPAHYAFGEADLAALVQRLGPGVASRTEDGAPAFDVAAGVRVALGRAGVDGLDDCGECTAGATDGGRPRYFSHRRDTARAGGEGATGRQVTVAVLGR